MYKTLLTLAISTLLFSLTPSDVFAKVQYSEGEVVISKNEVVSDDLYVAGKTVRVEGKVEGDLYIAAESVFVTGEITGDMTAIGGTIDVDGRVGQDAYLIGQNIDLSGAKVNDSLHMAGQTMTVSQDTLLGGSVIAAGETIKNNATVSRSLMLAGRNLRHDAPILGEARLAGESIYLGPKTTIAKDLTYFLSPEEGKLDSQAVVKGSTNVVTEPAEWRQNRMQDKQNQQNFMLLVRVWSYIGMLLVGAVLLWLTPKLLDLAVSSLHNNSMAALGSGLLISILTIPALVLLSLTVIGIPLAGVVLPLYLVLLYLGKIVFAFALARTVSTGASLKMTPLMEMFVGVTLLHLLKLIPVGGYFIGMIATWIGVGAIYLSVRKKN